MYMLWYMCIKYRELHVDFNEERLDLLLCLVCRWGGFETHDVVHVARRIMRSSFRRDLPKNAYWLRKWVPEFLLFGFLLLFFFQNRFGSTINGFRRGALVSEKAAVDEIKIKKTVKLWSAFRRTVKKKRYIIGSFFHNTKRKSERRVFSSFFLLPIVKLGEFNNITHRIYGTHIHTHTDKYTHILFLHSYIRTFDVRGTFKHDMW